MSAAFVSIPKDLEKIKNKLVFGLTKRQLLGLAPAFFLGLPIFFAVNSVLPQEVAMIALLVVSAPPLFLAIYERDGMPAEEWLKNYLKYTFLSTAKRRYKKPVMTKKAVDERIINIKKEQLAEKKIWKEQVEKSGAYFTLKAVKKETLLTVLNDCLELAVKKFRKLPIPEKTTQDTLFYRDMYKDGVCRIDDTRYSKTITFEDINYRLAHIEDKNMIFSEYCAFLNGFDDTVKVQFTFVNEMADIENEKAVIQIELRSGDDLDEIREEYQNMIRDQLEKGNNGLVRRKYITFTIEARNLPEARQRLYRIESDAINLLQTMSVQAYPVTGEERLQIFHRILNDPNRDFQFDWKKCHDLGLRTHDFIAPPTMDFTDKRYFRTGKKYAATQVMILLASELSDKTLANFLDLETEMIVNLHVEAIDHQKALKFIKTKVSDVDKMKIEEQRKANQSGYDMDVLPPDLKLYEVETKRILEDLTSQNEKWFLITVLVTSIADKKSKLDSDMLQVKSIALKSNCDLKPYDFNQEDCLMSTIPIGVNLTYPRRGLNTSAFAAPFIPFTTQELFMSGEACYYGLNSISNNIIMADRKRLVNPNGLILGVPGSGKSFAAKREITNSILVTNDFCLVCDPEGEYSPLIKALGGEVIDISMTSKHHVNPLDINLDFSDDVSPLALKVDFVLSMMEIICGGRHGLEAREKSIIARCVEKIYQPYLADPIPEKMPILGDLYNAFIDQKSDVAHELAEALELYVTGTLKVFNNRTNVDTSNRLVCYNIKGIGTHLRRLGMLIIQDQVWNTVTINRNTGKSTWYYVDEFHLLLKEPQTASYSVDIWKRFRKWGGIPTGITQNIKDLLSSPEIENIFENSDFVLLLRQAPGDREIIAKKLNISRLQLGYVENSPAGNGLIKYGPVILPFKDKFPDDTKLYKVMTTKPNEQAAGKAKAS